MNRKQYIIDISNSLLNRLEINHDILKNMGINSDLIDIKNQLADIFGYLIVNFNWYEEND